MKQKLSKKLKTGNRRCLSVINQSESLTLMSSVSTPALKQERTPWKEVHFYFKTMGISSSGQLISFVIVLMSLSLEGPIFITSLNY